MCGRIVNLDTVARVLAEYYHLKTDTQLAALDEALSRVPAETVGKELFGNSEQLDATEQQKSTEQPSATDTNVGSTDTISRAGALDALNGIEISRNASWYEFYQKAITAVGELPSAQQERKKGKWIERNPRNSPDCRLIECSECGNAYIVGYNINYDDWIDGRNFCMKCGADLRGGSNGKNT